MHDFRMQDILRPCLSWTPRLTPIHAGLFADRMMNLAVWVLFAVTCCIKLDVGAVYCPRFVSRSVDDAMLVTMSKTAF